MTRIRSVILLSCIALLFTFCKQQTDSYTLNGKLILVDSISAHPKDSLVETTIMNYRQSLEADMNRVIVFSAHVMERGTPEGRLNNFVADLVMERGNRLYYPTDGKTIDFCLLNYGGLRVPLPEGEITYGRVFELLPFENEMVVLTLSGEKTNKLFQILGRSTVGMPVSGVTFSIRGQQPVDIMIQGEPLDITRNYKVLTSDYLAGGGDNMDFLLQPINYELLGMRVRDAIIKHMEEVNQRSEKIRAETDQRIRIIN